MSGILVTGGGGFIGAALLRHLQAAGLGPLYAVDWRPVTLPVAVQFRQLDIRDGLGLRAAMVQWQPDAVVHLASVVAAGGDADLDRAIDVGGTENVLQACLVAGVKRLVLTSSGAAYGYHADNPQPLNESHALRGNPDFPYADNKRRVEEMLAHWRSVHPQLQQVVFRPCTVLGPGVDNQITAIFKRPMITGLAGSATPFSFVSEADVVAALARAADGSGPPGIYNLAGDGTLSLRQIARRIGKPYLPIPPALMKAALWVANKLGLTRLGPGQVRFLQFRPVLDNSRLKAAFGYRPQHDSAAAFDRYWQGAVQ